MTRPPDVPGSTRWPTATLGPIARARVLAASIPGAAWVEGTLDGPYAATWAFVRDLERSVPAFDTQVRRLWVAGRWTDDGAERLRIRATSMGVTVPFEARLEDGYCLMQARARLYLVVMAAEPDVDEARTRFLHLEAVPLPGTRVMRRYLARVVRSDFANLSRIVARGV